MKKQKGLTKDSYCFDQLIPLAPLNVFAPISVSWQPLASQKMKKSFIEFYSTISLSCCIKL